MFSDTDVLKISVATRNIIVRFVKNVTVKKITNWLKFDEVTLMSSASPF